jgi:uncharacterized protein with FMN-binding domain
MNTFLNFGLAWISVLLVLILCAKIFIRKSAQVNNLWKPFMIKLNRLMKHTHIYMGICLIIIGLVHGLYSSTSVFSFNIGTLSWILSILLGVNWMIRKHMKNVGVWMYYHRILTIIFLTTIVCHVIEVGGIQVFEVLNNTSSQITQNTTTSISPSDTMNNNLMDVVLKDGTYSGEATGYGPNLKVSVLIESNLITEITVTSHNEVNPRFYSTPIEEIPQSIIDSQGLDVDAVSGATFTSTGIINAVNDALTKALVSGNLPTPLQLPVKRGHGR